MEAIQACLGVIFQQDGVILPCPALPTLDVPKLALEVESCVARLRKSQ